MNKETKVRTRAISALAAVLTASLVIAACGSSSSSSSSSSSAPAASSSSASGGSATLNGAGSTLAAPIYQQWGSNLKGQGLTVNYNPVGSGTGIADLQTATVAFAGSDPSLKPMDVTAMKGPPLQFPVAFGAITVSYNLPGIKSGLKLDGPTIADIFSGKIKTWNDPAIKSLNPGLNLPSTAITVVHRSDSSGTTDGFTTYLSDVSSTWKSTIGAGKDVKWPVGTGAAKNSGVAAAVKQTTGRGRLRRAGVRARERIHVRVGQELGRHLHPADDLEHVGGGGRGQGPGGPRDLDDQLAQPAGIPDRLADVPGRLQGPLQGRRRELGGRQRSEEVPDLRVRGRAEDARVGQQPAPLRAAARLAGGEGHHAARRR